MYKEINSGYIDVPTTLVINNIVPAHNRLFHPTARAVFS